MKFLTFLSLFVVTLPAWALTPKLGDSATYRSIYTNEGGEVSESLWSKTILEFNSENTKAKLSWSGEFGETQEWISISILGYILDDVKIYCAKLAEFRNATLETIETAFGPFLTCKIEQQYEDGSYHGEWRNPEFPFGKVKEIYRFSNGSTDETVLIKFYQK